MSHQNEFSRGIRLEHIDRQGIKQVVDATEEECKALARRLDLRSLKSFKAKIDIKPLSDKITYHAQGTFEADLVQACVVSDQDVPSIIKDDLEGWFRDYERVASFEKAQKKSDHHDEHHEMEMPEEADDPEGIVGGVIDIGELAVQFLSLALNPYPHASGINVEDYIENDKAKPNPFAALEVLKGKN